MGTGDQTWAWMNIHIKTSISLSMKYTVEKCPCSRFPYDVHLTLCYSGRYRITKMSKRTNGHFQTTGSLPEFS